MKKQYLQIFSAFMSLAFVLVSSVIAFGQKGELIRAERPIPNQYIVVFNAESLRGIETCERGDGEILPERNKASDTSVIASFIREFTVNYEVSVEQTYGCAVQGFSANMSEEQALRMLQDPRVDYIEEDAEVFADTTQFGATWGLDRLDRRSLPLNGEFHYNSTGAGVHAYIIDTGIRPTHNEFSGRATANFDALGGNGIDCNGHGTHVAGTVGGETFGVAKDVTLHGVRVLNCSGSGSNASVIAGVNWVMANHINPSIANMSLGGSASTTIDTAVNNAINAGTAFAVAAGNDNGNACNKSPARVPAAITVGATQSNDKRSSFSNFGTCLDIFAPGTDITSAWSSSNTATNTISGTSMASPHVAGVAALFLQNNPGASPAAVANSLISTASVGKVTNAGSGSPNRLLFWNEATSHCTDPVYYFNGTYINPWYDTENCYVKPAPANTTPFVYNNSYYTQKKAGSFSPAANKTCPSNTTWDGANCYVLPFPAWNPTHFVYNNALYLTKGPGNSCPAGSWYDGANCYVMPMPASTSAFKYGNSLYITAPPYCPEGFYDGANCYIGTAPSGTQAFVLSNTFYYAE